ncbi:MAG TPA: hypothetical protein VIL85_15955 [Thermomicrobiales bacterium]|jgi:hypothetical protein
MISILNKFNNRAEIRESKDEILVGEIVRAMSRQGYVSVKFVASPDLQRASFKALNDPVLTYLHITLDRKTGGGAISSALIGAKATLTISAEVKNYIADPDDLVAMYRTDLANIFRMPVLGGVKLNHELNSIFATTTKLIEINDYVLKGEAGAQRLIGMLDGTIDDLRDRLRAYKK